MTWFKGTYAPFSSMLVESRWGSDLPQAEFQNVCPLPSAARNRHCLAGARQPRAEGFLGRIAGHALALLSPAFWGAKLAGSGPQL